MMSTNIPCSLIIATYNWPQALKKCLQSVAWQKQLPAEVIIADDGSPEDTAQMIRMMQEYFPIPLIHLTQKKKGRRKTRIINIATIHAQSPYLIFIDHDMMLHPEFIGDHLALAEKKFFINGSRFLSDEQSTKEFLKIENPTPADLHRLKGKNSLNKLRLPFLMHYLAHRYRTDEKHVPEVRGCNMSFWKDDLIAVNGFNEEFGEWGREDSDVAVRLYHYGVKKKSLKFGGIAWHLFHQPGNKADDPKNLRMLQETIDQKKIKAAIGLDQYLQ